MEQRKRHEEIDPAVRTCFRQDVTVGAVETGAFADAVRVSVFPLAAGSTEPDNLDNDNLPYLCLPADRPVPVDGEGGLVLVAVEGKDRLMAESIAELLDPRSVVIGLMHVTWMPRTVDSPLGSGGLNNPDTGELLLYHGAREALVVTAHALREAGFDVSTHLREDRDPAVPLTETILQQQPDLVVLGLGRHGAGIARRVLAEARVPMLFVKAR